MDLLFNVAELAGSVCEFIESDDPRCGPKLFGGSIVIFFAVVFVCGCLLHLYNTFVVRKGPTGIQGRPGLMTYREDEYTSRVSGWLLYLAIAAVTSALVGIFAMQLKELYYS